MKLPTYFLTHGGGPWPYMPEMRDLMRNLELSIRKVPHEIGTTPKAVLAISAHWEDAAFSVMAHPRPSMLYDYHGFPAHTYRVTYAAPGSPALARRVQNLLESAGVPTQLDAQRGFDHGAFVPLGLMYPNADVPVVQLSLQRDLDPAQHLAVGQALAPMREENVLIVASGSSYHNQHRLGPAGKFSSEQFDGWLQDTLIGSTPAQRHLRLLNWCDAPSARVAHPREEHLLPLMVAVGAAHDEPAELVYYEQDLFGGLTGSSFRFGAAPGRELSHVPNRTS